MAAVNSPEDCKANDVWRVSEKMSKQRTHRIAATRSPPKKSVSGPVVGEGGQLKIPRACLSAGSARRRRVDEIAIKIPSRSDGITEAVAATM